MHVTTELPMTARIAPHHVLNPRGLSEALRGAGSARSALAVTLELTLDPRRAARRGLPFWPRIPRANREAIAEPLRQIVGVLRDSRIAIPDGALARIRALATNPTSPAYGHYPNRARFAAWSLADELCACNSDGR
jgi:hypothetical protein